MGKYIGRTFILLFTLCFVFPSLAIGGGSALPSFGVLTKGGVSLKPGDFRVGRILLHPGFAFETRYDSNILNEADQSFANGSFEGRTDDFIFTNKPSMGIALERAPGEVFGFNFDYKGRDENFLEEGGTQSFFNHKIDGAVNLGGPGGRGDVTIGGGWEKAVGSTLRDLNSNIGARQSRIVTNGLMDVRYSLSKILKLRLNAAVSDEKYQGQKIQNVDEYDFGGSLFWQATKPVAFGVKYNHRLRRYEIPSPLINDNSDGDQAFLAMKWIPTSLFSGEVAVGYDTRRYKTIKGDNIQGLVYQVNMQYQPVKRTNITFYSGREYVDSTFQSIQAYILSNAFVGVSQRLGKKITASLDVLYENLDYRRSVTDAVDGGVKTRVDNSISGTVGLSYAIQKWLEARGSYQYEENFSNFDTVDYKKHVGRLELSAKY